MKRGGAKVFNAPISALRVAAALMLLGVAACGPKSPSGAPSLSGNLPPSGFTELPASPSESPSGSVSAPVLPGKNPEGVNIQERFTPPEGFARVEAGIDSFAEYLRHLPLKADGVFVSLADGTGFYVDGKPAAVFDVEVTRRTMSTDAFLLLRALYLHSRLRADEINFHFLSGFEFPFYKWAEGYRLSGREDPKWGASPSEPADGGEDGLYKYLDYLFSNTNARAVSTHDTRAADSLGIGCLLFTFNASGTPINAAMVADMAVNDRTGQIAVVLIRGGGTDTATDIYVMLNNAMIDNPWCQMSEGGGFYTAEGLYMLTDAKDWA